jgi:hypothetical protein
MKQFAFFCIVVILSAVAPPGSAQASASHAPTANDGQFVFDVPGLIERSDVVLGRPNLEPGEAMPLGNGRLGVAVWSADGFTAQLNRNDTLPDRLSPGQVEIPGLAALTHAKDYAGRLDLYRGEFREQGGGMTTTAYVEPDTGALIVAVTGADPLSRPRFRSGRFQTGISGSGLQFRTLTARETQRKLPTASLLCGRIRRTPPGGRTSGNMRR